MDDVVTLIKRRYQNDDFGVLQIVDEQRREVMCSVQSANRAEFLPACKQDCAQST